MSGRERLNLSPAESLAILDPEGSDGKKMMKLTVADLMLRDVLRANVREEMKGKLRKKLVKKTYVGMGDQFSRQNLRPHEDIFKRCLGDRSNEVGMDDFAKKVYEKAGGFPGYKRDYVCDPLCAGGYLHKEKKKRLLLFSVITYALSSQGLIAQSTIRDLLREGEENLGRWVQEDPTRAKAYLLGCGANVLLMEQISPHEFQEWNKALAKIDVSESTMAPYDYWLYDHSSIYGDDPKKEFGFFDFDLDKLSFLDSFEDFDSSFDDVDSGGDSDGGYDD